MAMISLPPAALVGGRQGSNNFNVAELAQTLFEEAGDALFLFDPETEKMVDVNPMAEQLCGFSSAELLTMKITYLFRSEAKGGLGLLRQAFQKTGFFHSQDGFLMRHQKDGVWVPVNLTVSRLHTRPKLLAMITARDIRERRSAEKELQKTEAELRRVLVSVSDCVWEAEIDAQGRWTRKYMSPVIESLTGRPAEYYTDADCWLGTFHPDDRSRGQECLARLHSGASTHEELEYRILRPDGALRWLRDNMNARHDAARGTRTLHGISSDITARKEAEEALQQQQALLQNIIRHIPMSVFWKDRNSVYMGCNAQNARDLGAAKPEDLLGKTDLDMGFAPGEAEFYRQCDREVMDSGQPLFNIEETQRRPDGTNAVLLTSKVPLRDATGQVTGLLGIYADITERKRTEEALRDSEARKAHILDGALDCIITIDHEGKVVEFNPAAERTFGYERAQALGQQLSDLIIPPELREAHRRGLAHLLATGDGPVLNRRLELTAVRADGTRIPVELTVTRSSKDGLPLFTGFLRDLTELKKLEEQFRQSQKMEAVGRLAGGVAHDFNNLLTIISGYTDLMRSKNLAAEACHGLLTEIQTAADRAASLTRQLLTFSRKQLLAPRVLDVNRLVTNMEKMLRRLIGEDIKFKSTLAPDLGKVRADGGQLEQILLNLAINARDAMPSGGSLRLHTFNIEVDHATATTHPEVEPGPYVALEVTDTGCGMSDEVKAHLFEPFFTTKEVGKGTGLGLATVYGIVKQSQGHINVSSKPGEGTTFTILLPRVESIPSPGVEDGIKEPAPRGWETVLLAEDEEAVRALARIVLQGAGYNVLEAHDGVRALEVSRAHRGPIHLLLTDVIMPRLSGPQAAQVLSAERAEMKVLYFSGYTNDAIAEHGVLDQSVAFLQKPVSPDALARKVREVLDGGRASETVTEIACA